MRRLNLPRPPPRTPRTTTTLKMPPTSTSSTPNTTKRTNVSSAAASGVPPSPAPQAPPQVVPHSPPRAAALVPKIPESPPKTNESEFSYEHVREVSSDSSYEVVVANLPDGWRQQHDPQSGRSYYVDPNGTCQWERPFSIAEEKETVKEEQPAEEIELPMREERPTTQEDISPLLPPGWTQSTTEEGAIFYVSPEGVSQWDPPIPQSQPPQREFSYENVGASEPSESVDNKEAVTVVKNEVPPATEPPLSQEVETLPDGWSRCETDDGEFYYSAPDGTTQWEPPVAAEEPPTVEPEPLSETGPLVAEEEEIVVEPRMGVSETTEPEPEPASVAEENPQALPEGWSEYTTEDGTKYFVSPSGEAQWEPPVPLDLSPIQQESLPVTDSQTEPGPPAGENTPATEDEVFQPAAFPRAEEATSESAVEEKEVVLPDGWSEYITDDGVPYYVSPSNETQWKPPMAEDVPATEPESISQPEPQLESKLPSELELPVVEEEESTMAVTNSEATVVAEPEQTMEEEKQLLPEGWFEYTTEDGTPYYVSPAGDTQWEPPVITSGPPTEPEPLLEPELPAEPERPAELAPLVVEEEQVEPPAAISEVAEIPAEPEPTLEDKIHALPEGWSEYTTDDGIPYYVSPSNETQWEKPEIVTGVDVAEPESPIPQGSDEAHYETDLVENEERPEIAGESADIALPPGWVEYTTDDGQQYYVSPSGETQWEMPGAAEKIPEPATFEPEVVAPPEGGEAPVANPEVNLAAESSSPESAMPEASSIEMEPSEGPGLAHEEPENAVASESDRNLALPEGWMEYSTDDGTPFFVAPDGSTQWDPPVSSETSEADASQPELEDQGDSAEQALPEGWKRFTLEDGSVYYVEPGGTPTWEAPKPSAPEETDVNLEGSLKPTQSISANIEEHPGSVAEKNDVGNHHSPPTLPEGWAQYETEDGTYYVDPDGNSTWELPKIDSGEPEDREVDYSLLSPVSDSKEADSQGAALSGDKSSDVAPPEEAGNEYQEGFPTGWTEYTDPTSGRPYFVNDETGETSWDRPAEAVPAAAPPSEPRAPSIARKPGRPRCAAASFGFGGRLCMLQHDSGIAVLRRTHMLIPTDSVPLIEAEKKTWGIEGPMNLQENDLVLSFLQEKASSDLLWHLVYILAQENGTLSGAQAALTKLLLKDDTGPQPKTPLTRSDSFVPDVTKRTEIEKLLLHGQHEDAVVAAKNSHDYAMAMLISSMSGNATLFSSVATEFVRNSFSEHDPLHAACLVLICVNSKEHQLLSDFFDQIDPQTLRSTWKSYVASIISNPSTQSREILSALGDKLREIFGGKQAEASHFCYVTGGCSLGRPGAKITLLGHDMLSSDDFLLTSRTNVEAFARTEAYEWAKRRGNPAVSIRSLQTFKLLYAAVLCDYGYTKIAGKYLDSVVASLGGRDQVDKINPIRASPIVATVYNPGDEASLVAAVRELEGRLRSSAVPDVDSKPDLQNFPVKTSHLTSDRVRDLHHRLQKPVVPPTPDTSLAVDASQDVDSSFMTAQTNVLEESFVASAPPLNKSEEKRSTAPISEPVEAIRNDGLTRAPGPEKKAPTVNTNRDETSSKAFKPLITPAATTTERKPAPMSAPANLQTSKGKKKSLFNFGIQSKITKFLNPEATQADLGEGMQAYYDEKLKVWVFPGEDPAEVAKPVGPPPTAPAKKPADPPPEESEKKPKDPLAAMMAPPSTRSRIPIKAPQKPKVKPSKPAPAFFIPSPAPAKKPEEK